MPLPDGDVALRDVLEWVQEQAQFLTPTQHHVLFYLASNAFVTNANPENRKPGDVYSGRCALSKIAHRTGLSQRAVRYALDALQEAGYVVAELQPGHGKSKITVFWMEAADEMRAEFRSGSKPLPKGFQKVVKAPKKQAHLASVVDIRSGKRCHNMRQEVPE
jgi:DNA-binding MarR family transcriptional regulator